MRSRSPYQLALVFALCLASHPLAAQAGASGRPIRLADIPTVLVHISGTVVSSLDGKPVSRVLVTSPDRHFAALTDWQGRFACDYRMPDTSSLNAASQAFIPGVQFQLQKPGYVFDHGVARIPAPASGSSSTAVQLKITPESVISGHVSPDTGEIPNGLQAMVRRRQVQEGLGTWVPAGFAQVDRNGEFRFANLTAGDYLVMTSGHNQTFAPRQRPDTMHGLLPTYFPSGSTIAEASRVHVGPGETVSLDLRPSSATLYRISVSVSGISSADNFNASLVSDVPAFNIIANSATRTVEGYLPSGSYTFRINTYSTTAQVSAPASSGEGPRVMLYAGGPIRRQTTSFAHLTVGSAPIIGQTITAAPASDIQVNVTRDFTTQQQQSYQDSLTAGNHRSPSVFITLQSVEGINAGQISSTADAEGDNITLRSVPEGTYHVRIMAPAAYVASASSGATNLLAAPLVVGPNGSSAPIDITLRDDLPQVTFRPQTAQTTDPLDAVMILAIPLDSPELNASTIASYGQRFVTPYNVVPPGRYLVIAGPVERIQALEYRDPEVLRSLTGKGVLITLSPGEKTAIDVPLLPEGDK